jgi:hypothetical protein
MKPKKPKDRHLDVPQEANRDKHINFIALENNDADPADIEDEKTLEEKIEEKKKRTNNRTKED